jgi:hypothetical protein
MADVASPQPGVKRRPFINARLAAAAIIWSATAVGIGLGKAEAGVPVASSEWNRTWDDFRRWVLNPPGLTPIQRLNGKHMIPVLFLMYSDFPATMLTDRFPLIVLWGA